MYPEYPEFDSRDAEILAERQRARDELATRLQYPLVGDLVDMGDGSTKRVTHVWRWEPGETDLENDVQLTSGSDGRFYLGDNGGMSYSGGLDPSIPMRRFTPTGTATVRAWFFHHGHSGAHRGVDCTVTVRRWALQAGG